MLKSNLSRNKAFIPPTELILKLKMKRLSSLSSIVMFSAAAGLVLKKWFAPHDIVLDLSGEDYDMYL